MVNLDAGDNDVDVLDRLLRGGSPANVGYGPLAGPVPDTEDQNRLSVGQRIAGAIKPQSPPAQTDQAPQVKPPFDPNLVPESIRPRTMPAPDQIARPPVGANSQRRLDLMAEESRLNKPTDPGAIDPNTGKPKYRMGWGQRLIGTLANAATGFSGRGGPSVYVGPGATNWKYDREENLRGQRLAGVQSDLNQQEKLEATQERSYADTVKGSYDAAMADARRQLGLAAEENAGTRASLADSQRQLNLARANKADADPSDHRLTLADKYGLKGQARTDYILTGKLPKEMLGSGRQPTELETWAAAFRRDNGREPTADEIATRRSNRASQVDRIERDKDTALQRAEDKAAKRIGYLSDPMHTFDPTDPHPLKVRKQAIYDDLEKEKQQIQKEYETRAAANASAGRPAQRNAASKIDPNNLPGRVMVDGRLRTVVGYNSRTGKLIVAPAGQ